MKIGKSSNLQTTNKTTWINEINIQYDYKKNLTHLRERYLNKIKWLADRLTNENRDNYYGIMEGLKMAICDLDDILDGLEV